MRQLAVVMVLGLVLGGCSSSDDEPTEAFCTAFVGPTPVWTACNAGCARANEGQAYDGNLNTTATIVPQPGQTTYTTTLTASSTADIPSGAVPGVFLTQPNSANFVTMNTSMRTILNGVEAEVLNPGNEEISLSESGTPATGFLGMRTTEAFDQLELTVTVTWGAGDVPNYFIYEICSDGGNI